LDFKLKQFMDLGLNSKVNNNQIAYTKYTNLLSDLISINPLCSRILIKRNTGHGFDTVPEYVFDAIIGIFKKGCREIMGG
jgi:hypothetical protein